MNWWKPQSIVFHNSIVLGTEGQIADSIRIRNGKIVALNVAPQENDCALDLEGRMVLPGLVNAHDHLGVNNFGRIKYRETYRNAHEWSLDIEARFNTDPALVQPRAVPIADRLFIGGIKNLLAGVTLVCHHDPWHPSLNSNFPVRVARPFGYCHSLQRGGDIKRSFKTSPRGAPWIIHLAEGTDAASARELDTLDKLGGLNANTVIVHGVGLTRKQQEKIIERGAAMIWCPSSNFFLLGRTTDVRGFAKAGRVALGTDSRLTGEKDLWHELRAANTTAQLTPRELFRLVTRDAAEIVGQSRFGEIKPRALADLVILSRPIGDPFNALMQFHRADVQLVIVGGKPLYGDPEFNIVFDAFHVAAQKICVDGHEKLLAQWLAQRLARNSIHEPGVEIQ